MKELRTMDLQKMEIRAIESNHPDQMILEGYAAVFNSPTVLATINGVEYKEVIERSAFDRTDMSDCCLKYNHESSVPILARSRGGSLKLTVDDKGLFFRANLFPTQAAKDVYTLVKAGGLDKCSFAFSIDDKGDEYDKANHMRKIKSISTLWDCSIVDVPAYNGTSVSARSWAEAEAEAEQKELENAELRKRLIERLGGKHD